MTKEKEKMRSQEHYAIKELEYQNKSTVTVWYGTE